mgnify:CR=1 FL=1
MPDTQQAVFEKVKSLVKEIDDLKDARAGIGEQIREKQRELHDLVLAGEEPTES